MGNAIKKFIVIGALCGAFYAVAAISYELGSRWAVENPEAAAKAFRGKDACQI